MDRRLYSRAAMQLNTVICGDAADALKAFPANCVHLALTSPPYDDLRTYENGATFDFPAIAAQLYRVAVEGGVVVWVVGDACRDGSETGTSFRHALGFKDCGFRLHDTMIYQRSGPPLNHARYEQHFEYMFVLSKGAPRVFNGLKEPATSHGSTHSTARRRGGHEDVLRPINRGRAERARLRLRGNVWKYAVGAGRSTDDSLAHEHPAIFPDQLALDHVATWSNPGDLVLDPMCGSGTTGKAAVAGGRDFIGIDSSAQYCALARQRIWGTNNLGLVTHGSRSARPHGE